MNRGSAVVKEEAGETAAGDRGMVVVGGGEEGRWIWQRPKEKKKKEKEEE